MPSKLSPNSVFSESFELVEKNTDVVNMLGSPMKGYGKDHGGRRAGRRNHISSQQWKDDGGIDHTRILYTAEGPSGGLASVFVEKTSAQGDGDFVYIVVQDQRTGKVIPVIDNRETIPIDTIQGNLVDKLNAKNIVLYGGDNERWTQEQKAEFGRHAYKIKYVNCEAQRALCEQAGVRGLPSWLINGTMVPGFRKLDDLDVISKGAKINE
jgi:hypothetical protein